MTRHSSRFSTEHEGQIIDTRGYVVDEPYINRFFDLQSPTRMLYSLRCAGFDPTYREDFSYCDLGCGYGLTVLYLAHCHPEAQFVGVDINPHHIQWAQQMAEAHGMDNVQFLCLDFADADSLGGPFDYITAHGIYTWVEPSVQRALLGFASKHLAPEGLFYMSYNSYPGWSGKEPLWRIFNMYAETVEGSSLERAEATMEFLGSSGALTTRLAADNPSIASQFEHLRHEDLRYVAHEYCNKNFKPVYPAEAFAQLKDKGLEFLAQAETIYSHPQWNLPEHVGPVPACENRLDYENWISFLRNDEFRSDIYARSCPPEPDTPHEALWSMTLAALVPLEHVQEDIPGSPMQLKRDDPLVQTLLDCAQTPGQTLEEIAAFEHLVALSPGTVMATAQALELSGLVRFVDITEFGDVLNSERLWAFANPLAPTLLQEALATENVCYLPLPKYRTAIRVDKSLAFALMSLSTDAPVQALCHALNTIAPEIMEYQVSEGWAANHLMSVQKKWCHILGQGGAMVDKT